MLQLFEAVARARALLVMYHTDTDIRVWRKVAGEGRWRTHGHMYPDHDGAASCFLSTDGEFSAKSLFLGPEEKSTGTDDSWFGQLSSIHPL